MDAITLTAPATPTRRVGAQRRWFSSISTDFCIHSHHVIFFGDGYGNKNKKPQNA